MTNDSDSTRGIAVINPNGPVNNEQNAACGSCTTKLTRFEYQDDCVTCISEDKHARGDTRGHQSRSVYCWHCSFLQ